MLRIDKYLADCGIGTRSEVKKYIKAKQITVNGEIILKPELKIDENTDKVCFKGQPTQYEKYVYYMLHKPAGCVTAKQDNVHKTVMEYFSEDIRTKDISPVGRLDLDTEGLLIFTNDGSLTHHLLSPTHHIPKTYYAILDKELPNGTIEQFKKGIDIGDEKITLPAELMILTDKEVELTIQEGRFHQVKRMFEAVGCTVTYLKRISMGTLKLGDLPKGEYRKLSEEEVRALQE